jgi:hypothetical protein
MDTMTELEMWKLIRGTSCQFCGKRATQKFSLPSSDPWNAGPGLDNIRSIWPFRIRCCGPCLLPKLVKVSVPGSSFSSVFNGRQDVDAACFSNPELRFGLPYAFLTRDLNYVPSSVVHAGAPAPHLEPIKFYFRPQLEELESRFRNVEALGPATLGEWKKGLESAGRDRNADAIRFEQCELHNGFAKILLPADRNRSALLAGFDLSSNQREASRIDRMQPLVSRSAAGTPSSGYNALESSMAGSVVDGKHARLCFSFVTPPNRRHSEPLPRSRN